MTGCSDLKKESKQELDELYLITLVLEHNGKEYEKEAFPLQSDCNKAFNNAERQFLNTPIKIKYDLSHWIDEDCDPCVVNDDDESYQNNYLGFYLAPKLDAEELFEGEDD